MLVMTIGIAMWLDIPKELAPDLQTPTVTVSHNWGRTSPEVMEQEVTRRVEQAARQLRDVQNIRSNTQEGRSIVTIDFHPDAPVDFRTVELQEYLYALRENFSDDVSFPSVSRRVPEEIQDMQNFLIYSVSGPRNQYDLLDFITQNIRLPLLGMQGVAEVEIDGAQNPALMIRFDRKLLDDHRIQPGMVMSQVRENLSWRSAGFAHEGDARYSIQIPPSFDTTEDIENLPIRLNDNRIIHLHQIASVAIQDYPAKVINRINGSPALTIRFIKESGYDTIRLAEELNKQMDVIIQNAPTDLFIQMEYDATEDLREQLTSLEQQAMISFVCVFLILLLFIRQVRAPLIILGSIIFSLLLSVVILYLMDYTLNVITLAGLTISLGMIIDNAVVVFEHLNNRLPQDRNARIDRIRKEIPHVFVPVFGATLTTVGIFIPVLFAMEAVRIFLMPLAVALTFTLVSSVLISLTWIPYALIWLVSPSAISEKPKKENWYTALGNYIFKRLNRWLLIVFHLRKKVRYVLIIGFTFLIGIPLFLIPTPEFEEEKEQEEWTEPIWYRATAWYFDNRDVIDPWIGGISYKFSNDAYFGERWIRPTTETLRITIRTPYGTPIEEIDRIAQGFEDIAEPYRHSMIYYETRLSELNVSRIIFHFDEEYLFRPEPYRLFAEASFLAARTGNSGISVSGFGEHFGTGFGGSSSNFNITMRGFSYDELEVVALRLKDRLEQNRRVQNVDINRSSPWQRDDLFHYVLKPDKNLLMSKGLSMTDIRNAILMETNPTNTFGQIEFSGRQMYLMGTFDSDTRYRQQFEHDFRKAGSDTRFRIDEVAYFEQERVMPQINRENQSYSRVVSFDFLGPYRFGQNFLNDLVDNFAVPLGVTIETQRGWFGFGSREEDINMLMIMFFALISVWMIVSALLEKWLDPMVVLLAVPLSAVGIMAGTLFHEINFDRSAMAGALLSAGVVVNNAILLMHGKEATRRMGIFGYRAWVYVYREKMRPVLITSLTTLGGLMPLVLMETSDFWQTLATVVCWGLMSSTLFILIFMGIWERKRFLGPQS